MIVRFKAILLSLAVSVTLFSCEKELSEENGGLPLTGGGSGSGGSGGSGSTANCKSCSYQPFCHGSTLTYIDSVMGMGTPSTTTINIVRDTIIDGKTFQKFTNPGADGYYNCSNGVSTVIAYQVPSSGGPVEKIVQTMLKANEAVGATWQDHNINGQGMDFVYNFRIAEKGITRTVLGVNFPDVIHVTYTSEITVPVLGNMVMSTTENYFAKNVGLIESETTDAMLGMVINKRVLQAYHIP